MKEIKDFKKAIESASNDAAHYMTAHLRSEAKASGWPSDIAKKMHVKHSGGSFDVHVHEKHLDRALDLEYGTPSTQPTAAVRRAANRTREAEHLLVSRISRIVGDL